MLANIVVKSSTARAAIDVVAASLDRGPQWHSWSLATQPGTWLLGLARLVFACSGGCRSESPLCGSGGKTTGAKPDSRKLSWNLWSAAVGLCDAVVGPVNAAQWGRQAWWLVLVIIEVTLFQ